LLYTPVLEPVTDRFTVAFQPTGSVPRLHVTVLEPLQVPRLELAETRLNPSGNTSVTTTPVAWAGPKLSTLRKL